jgi:hypothetical protein
MKPLDDYIRSNPERFEAEEPLSGHFERFDEKLSKAGKRKIYRTAGIIVRIAAVVLMTLIVTYAAFREFRIFNNKFDRIVSIGSYPELREAENFYSEQLDVYYSKLKKISFQDKTEKQQILDELSNMDRQAANIKKDLMQNPDDERVQNAIINYYQVKLEFMDMMISRAGETNKTML